MQESKIYIEERIGRFSLLLPRSNKIVIVACYAQPYKNVRILSHSRIRPSFMCMNFNLVCSNPLRHDDSSLLTGNLGIVFGNDNDFVSQIAWPKRITCETLVEQIHGEHRCLRFMMSIR